MTKPDPLTGKGDRNLFDTFVVECPKCHRSYIVTKLQLREDKLCFTCAHGIQVGIKKEVQSE